MNNSQMDRWIFYTVLALMAIGIIMVYSASAFYADKLRHDHLYYLKRQLLWVFLGIIVLLIAYKFPYEKLQGVTPVFVLISVVLLLYLLVTHSGRWIHVGAMNLQVSDVARMSLILFFADSLNRKEQYLKSFKEGFLPHLFYILLLAGLIVLQPDFSSAFMLALVGMAMLFISPIPVRYFFSSVLVFVPAAAGIIMASGYKSDRIVAFLHPEKFVLGKGYQIIQSLISLGTGGITGVGFAQSNQKMFFLPEAHTDFIFSIIGEEWGLLGTVVIVLLFLILMWRGIMLSNRSTDKFTSYLAFGLTVNLVMYAIVNMMVAVHLAPPTGLPLPFISYGGSSMLSSSLTVGLLLNISGKVNSQVGQRNNRFASRARFNYENRKLRYLR